METSLQPYQIVYLEADGERLYAEMIQIVPSRHLAWVRPLILVVSDLGTCDRHQANCDYYDLRQGADLFWPLGSFQPALDTDMIPILGLLGEMHPKGSQHHDRLRNFINRLWNLDSRQHNA
ncbi:hypothetical protein [Roseofilum casamattae]|uniref:Uncharacterized protein n=1 Tax=Roseofilum casamattae BLCC-M143 TaxID=3022442 RepID=A0ABT7BYU7_9CYAN|nr:hypothetical protein [Roseofilum casamattae]MDJ1184379.1 hypothetical protein [Roseofilum casamattae BLCC-M143]